MKTPQCKLFAPSTRYKTKVVRDLRFEGHDLIIHIQGQGFTYAKVVFRKVVGFRVLDERDLCEFWNEYSEPNGWLYEVEAGGWMELESIRTQFSSPSIIQKVREYLIVDDMCISVMTVIPPEIEDLGANPN